MKIRILFIYFTTLTILFVGLNNCSNNPISDNTDAYVIDSLISDSIYSIYPLDTIDAYMAMAPSDSTNGIFYYKNVAGNRIKHHYSTDSTYIYVDYNITLLELHKEITNSLFSRTHSMLIEWFFVSQNDTIAPIIPETMNSQKEIMEYGIEWSMKCFYKNLREVYANEESDYNLLICIYPVWMNDNIVTYCVREDTYTGGAHPNYDYFLESFSIKTGQALYEKDIFKVEKMDKVRALIVRHLAAKYEYPTVKDYLISVNKFRNHLPSLTYGDKEDKEAYTVKTFPIGTAGLRKEGVVFSYPRYSIAAGVYAVPTVLIPYDEIGDCLKIK